MNQRIRELATEVGISVEYLTNTKQIELIEKFAELIVRECVEVVEDSEGYSQYFPHVTKNIKKHFGVKQ